MKREITNKEEFEKLMVEADNLLRQKDVPIQGREIAALLEVAKILESELIGGPLKSGPVPDVYEGESLSAHIFQWITDRYGKRLHVDYKNGQSIILIRRDPWLIRFPVMYGEITVIADRDLSRTKNLPSFIAYKNGGAVPKLELNVLTCIKDLPQGLANDLSHQELKSILDFFVLGHQFLNKVNSFCREEELIMRALSDFNASAQYCMNGKPDFGLSRWASLQASEKIIKYFISRSGKNFPYTHKLKKLADIAYSLGLPMMNEKMLESIQCNPSVRYGEESINLLDVVVANHGTIGVGLTVFDKLFPGKHFCFNKK